MKTTNHLYLRRYDQRAVRSMRKVAVPRALIHDYQLPVTELVPVLLQDQSHRASCSLGASIIPRPCGSEVVFGCSWWSESLSAPT
jgi:hypothetical protein